MIIQCNKIRRKIGHSNCFELQIVHQEKCEEAEEEEENQEAVSVGVIGDCLSLDFNCPCGKGYQIVLSGKKCYYKLL